MKRVKSFGVRHPNELSLADGYNNTVKNQLVYAYPRSMFVQRQPRQNKPHLSVHLGLWWSSGVGSFSVRMLAADAARLMNYRQARTPAHG